MTGESIAARMAPTGTRIVIERHDWYDPERSTIHLAEKTARGRSLEATGRAAHEAAHAVQHCLRSWQFRLWDSWPIQSAELPFILLLLSIPLVLSYGWLGLVTGGSLLLLLTCLRMFAVMSIESDASKIAIAWLDLNTDMSVQHINELRAFFRKSQRSYWRILTT